MVSPAVPKTAPPIKPANISIENNNRLLLLFDPSKAFGIADKITITLYSSGYSSNSYIRSWPTTSSPSSILGGAEASQINMPGTAAQTKIVRIISQTAVIFSTNDSIGF